MRGRLLLTYIAFLALLFITGNIFSQPPRGPLVISPQVNADKTVTFRYLAPQAKEVKLSAQFLTGPVNMTKDTTGIWTVKAGPVTPDIYPYSFSVDGITVMDPANPFYFPNERFKASLADIPADTPLIHSIRNVPHGIVTYEYYTASDGTIGSLVVYTPPGYEKNPTTKFPVFYLIGGTTDTEETWFKVGRANLILDNLIAEKKARPMIIVMPYGNIAARVAAQKNFPKPADPTERDSPDAINRALDFGKDLVQHIIPYIEKNYRVIANSDNRAIGGFSRGGGQTLRTAFSNLDKFSWVCSFSSGLSVREMEAGYQFIYENPDATNKRLNLLWVGVGSEDFVYKPVIDFTDFLSVKKINYKKLITPGGHTWMNTKRYLAETAQLLFRE